VRVVGTECPAKGEHRRYVCSIGRIIVRRRSVERAATGTVVANRAAGRVPEEQESQDKEGSEGHLRPADRLNGDKPAADAIDCGTSAI